MITIDELRLMKDHAMRTLGTEPNNVHAHDRLRLVREVEELRQVLTEIFLEGCFQRTPPLQTALDRILAIQALVRKALDGEQP